MPFDSEAWIDFAPAPAAPKKKHWLRTIWDRVRPKTGRERMIELRDFIAAMPERDFDMGAWSFRSKTEPACVLGWGMRLHKTSILSINKRLGLSDGEANLIAYPTNSPGWIRGPHTHADLRPRHAVALLDRYLATGKIDWHLACQ